MKDVCLQVCRGMQSVVCTGMATISVDRNRCERHPLGRRLCPQDTNTQTGSAHTRDMRSC